MVLHGFGQTSTFWEGQRRVKWKVTLLCFERVDFNISHLLWHVLNTACKVGDKDTVVSTFSREIDISALLLRVEAVSKSTQGASAARGTRCGISGC